MSSTAPQSGKAISTGDLVSAYAELFHELGRHPSWTEMRVCGDHSPKTYLSHFNVDGWSDIPEHFSFGDVDGRTPGDGSSPLDPDAPSPPIEAVERQHAKNVEANDYDNRWPDKRLQPADVGAKEVLVPTHRSRTDCVHLIGDDGTPACRIDSYACRMPVTEVSEGLCLRCQKKAMNDDWTPTSDSQ